MEAGPYCGLKAPPWKRKTEGDFHHRLHIASFFEDIDLWQDSRSTWLEPQLNESSEQPPGPPELPDMLLPSELPEDAQNSEYAPSLPGDDDDGPDIEDDDPYSRLKNIPDLSGEHPEERRLSVRRFAPQQGSKRTDEELEALNVSSSELPHKQQRLGAILQKRQQRLSAVTQLNITISSVTNWVASLTGVASVTLKDGSEVPPHVS